MILAHRKQQALCSLNRDVMSVESGTVFPTGQEIQIQWNNHSGSKGP
jgi:hypothetical protein